jgi:excisionase family DNA binding protein
MPSSPAQFWEISDVAFWLSVPTKRVKEMVRDNVIPHVKLPGGEVLFDVDELHEWVQQFRQPGRGVFRAE